MDNQLIKTTQMARKAMWFAQYKMVVFGDHRYYDAIRRYYGENEERLYPYAGLIKDTVMGGRNQFVQDVFEFCEQEYNDNYDLINAWMNQAGVK